MEPADRLRAPALTRPLRPCALCGIFLHEQRKTLDFNRIPFRIPPSISHDSPLQHNTSTEKQMSQTLT